MDTRLSGQKKAESSPQCQDVRLAESAVWGPPGLCTSPILFLMIINNLDVQAALVTTVKKFADATKLGQIVRSDQDREALQHCLD